MTATVSVPNDTLRAVRLSMRMSQEEFAKALRRAGDDLNEPNDASKRLVQRWEGGQSKSPRAACIRALEHVTGRRIEDLGFTLSVMARVHDDGAGGHDMESASEGVAVAAGDVGTATESAGQYGGVWLSRYEYFSSGRDSAYDGKHYVVIVQTGNHLTARSLPGASGNPDSPLSLDLTLDRSVVTGTWTEQTASDGYYQGARYHGAIQMLVEPTGRRMAGKWVGFGKDFDVNTGPWELRLMDPSTSKATLERYSRPPE
ncbi:XRE family transcriptional regulator [Streptomyces sp. p1417]|uniref:XRE family transcriptional regulator n=1 Tax=Streptomyces typhae TaxID=2681492 RepID=A0A6L6X0I0_9ACTN|nr:XRE family transcriptional regulator [Streptomyces typhae]MVO87179.1 XRE family transcriptional regulator [Streptomyces typhae]